MNALPGKVAAIETASHSLRSAGGTEIDGLTLERALVFPSGLAILLPFLPN